MKVKCPLCGNAISLNHLMNHKELDEMPESEDRGEDMAIEYLQNLLSTLAPLTTALPAPTIQDARGKGAET